MVDRVSEEKRSWIMSRVGSQDTKPEIIVRRFLHAKGFRYRLHNQNIIGKPDLSNQKRKIAVFVHGCFWHSHKCKYGKVRPKTNEDFWTGKRKKTIQRDKKNYRELINNDWTYLIIWECELKNIENTIFKIMGHFSLSESSLTSS